MTYWNPAFDLFLPLITFVEIWVTIRFLWHEHYLHQTRSVKLRIVSSQLAKSYQWSKCIDLDVYKRRFWSWLPYQLKVKKQHFRRSNHWVSRTSRFRQHTKNVFNFNRPLYVWASIPTHLLYNVCEIFCLWLVIL